MDHRTRRPKVRILNQGNLRQEGIMFALRMIQLIEAHAEQLSEELMHKLERSQSCLELLERVPRPELKLRTHEIYRNLSDWLFSKTEAEIEERYMGLGVRRATQGVPFSEFLIAMTATKECLWGYLEREDFLDQPVELLGDMDLMHALERFFDRITYSAAVGYESVQNDVRTCISDSWFREAATRRRAGMGA
jgi:hypothetical protein